MTLFELGRSSGRIALGSLLAGGREGAPDTGLRLAELVELLCVGGWPAFTDVPARAAQRAHAAYLEEVARVDIGEKVDTARGGTPAVLAVVVGTG